MIIDKKEIDSIIKELKDEDMQREEVIQLSRTIIKQSKIAIYSLHRSDKNSATKEITAMKKNLIHLKKIKTNENMAKVAFQEYVEAATFYAIYAGEKFPTRKKLGVTTQDYLLGLCDLTGELVRYGVKLGIDKKKKDVERIRAIVEDIYGIFLQFDLRNGELRKKSDAIKWNLTKLEDLVLGLSK